jgi:O-methyltransferase
MTAIEQVAGVSLITPARLENLVKAAMKTRHLPGEMAELGVYQGGSALVIMDTCPLKPLHLFDTFTGLPWTELPEHNPTGHDLSEGRFSCSAMDAMMLLADKKCIFHVGVFPETAAGLEDLRFSFVHVDCDLYASAKSAIEWFWPRMVPGGIMFFDDYGCDFTGVTDAVHEHFSESEIHNQVDRSNGFAIGCFVIKK